MKGNSVSTGHNQSDHTHSFWFILFLQQSREKLIAEKANLSERQVRRCLKSLQDHGYVNIVKKEGKHNVYTLREKINIKDADGTPQAIATWDYIPNAVKDTVAEIKNAVVT